ncbi:hypothetical protein DSO57_1017512 [Entomophthora muscae]|uniref:Uncharacterized protein n=1 Tax=Entomophthora muscae TaxID=34485 RepID=A0ACC2T4K8_9FUNG|nr:hypothetical protein DSO57_1017512 [Entomophthora muscae]
MLSFQVSQCKEWFGFFSHLGHSRVHGLTNQIYRADQPMYLEPSTFWSHGNFTQLFMDLAKRANTDLTKKCNRFWCPRQRLYYQWSGGSEISDRVACYENEQCVIQASLNSSGWSTKSWSSGLSRPVKTKPHPGYSINYHFYGPSSQAIFFNEVKMIIRMSHGSAGRAMVGLRKGLSCDLKINGKPAGVYGTFKTNLDDPI